jgi:hypothetical protein
VSTTPSGTVEVRELPAGETHLAHQAMQVQIAIQGEHEFVERVDGMLRPAG